MNRLNGKIKLIHQAGGIVLTDVESCGYDFSVLVLYSLALPAWLQIGNEVNIIFKETEVSIGKNLSGLISMKNQLPCKIININRGELLSIIEMTFENEKVTSVITTRSADKLELKNGDTITALIK